MRMKSSESICVPFSHKPHKHMLDAYTAEPHLSQIALAFKEHCVSHGRHVLLLKIAFHIHAIILLANIFNVYIRH